ncbi:hypothetical protein, partial [Streptomyces cellostaticus]|uniref:hypothetical protein n=1 Tax=Streptomyces cellostaticus TaxID=67285 RepID=UPI001ABEF319
MLATAENTLPKRSRVPARDLGISRNCGQSHEENRTYASDSSTSLRTVVSLTWAARATARIPP